MGQIRDVVQAEMKRQGLTQTGLAEAAGISRPNLAHWLGGQTKLREDSLERIFEVLGLAVVSATKQKRKKSRT